MCGIVGCYNFESLRRPLLPLLQQMTSLVAHRGPDASGHFIEGPVGLGHRRLSILDLNERGTQPMASADARFVITFNGEIYNYLELRQQLAAGGYPFRTETDTEVILALYTAYGVECVSRLNGMFAFAIWDKARQELFIARDRIGIKPVYYAETNDGLIFASEAKSLFVDASVGREADVSQLPTFFAFGYVPGSRTAFKRVMKLPPGSWMRANTDGYRVHQYWDVHYAPNETRSADETAEELRSLLADAFRIHLRSDVPLGVFLSGGLDSTAVVALMAEGGVNPIKTFSVGYDPGSEFDETPHARRVAQHFGTVHHDLFADPRQFRDFIPGYVWHMDEPVTEGAALSLYFVSKLLRQHVTVGLSGEGSDELFGGYDIYKYMQWLERYRQFVPRSARRTFERAAVAIGPAKLTKYLMLAREPLERRYTGVSLAVPGTVAGLFSRELSDAVASHEPASVLEPYYRVTSSLDPLSRMLYADLKTWLVDDLLIKADKMTMANGVELRVPFLDYRVVEFAATIPSRMKIRGTSVKWILKHALRRSIPPEILSRKKVGFPTPLARMFRANMMPYLRDTLLSGQSRSRGYFVNGRVEELIDEHEARRADHHQLLWRLVVLEEWHRAFVDGRALPAAVAEASSTSAAWTH